MPATGTDTAGALPLRAPCHPPPVVDLPASDLDAKITVADTEATPSDGKVLIAVQFFSNGTYVELASNATVTCNGTLCPSTR